MAEDCVLASTRQPGCVFTCHLQVSLEGLSALCSETEEGLGSLSLLFTELGFFPCEVRRVSRDYPCH